MVDPTENEKLAMEHASRMAGEYINSIADAKGTDIAKWSEDEWMTLINVIVTGYVEDLKGEPPFLSFGR